MSVSHSYKGQYVYLLFHPDDLERTDSLYSFLEDELGCNVVLPKFEDKPRVLRRTESSMLKTSDIIILYYGKGNLAWLYSKKAEIDKMAGYHRNTADFERVLICEPANYDPDELIELLDLPRQSPEAIRSKKFIPAESYDYSFIL